MARSTETIFETSHSTANDSAFNELATFAAPSKFKSATATAAPAAAKRRAIASPIPVAAPVTMAVCPFSSNMEITR